MPLSLAKVERVVLSCVWHGDITDAGTETNMASAAEQWQAPERTGDGLEPTLHAPLRLKVATVLARTGETEFGRVRDLAGVSDSVLSKQLAVLVAAGLAETSKYMADGRLRTRAALTEAGEARYRRHLRALLALVAATADRAG